MKEDNELKKPKTFPEQLKILEDRNMIVEDRKSAIRILSKTNYYRLTAYALQFKENDNYNNMISFNNLYRIYKFDKRLRNLILEILESIEISLRTYMAYTLSIKYGAEAHKNVDIYKNIKFYYGYKDINGKYHRGLKDEITREIYKNRKEPLVDHHIKNYNECFPTWVIVEILSFGMLSKMYSNLNISDQKTISRGGFNTNNILLESWIKNLAYIRNICAHYGRLYNKKLDVKPIIHKKYNKYRLQPKGLFPSILAIKELTINDLEWSTFKTQLEALIEEFNDVIDLSRMSFPQNWIEILS